MTADEPPCDECGNGPLAYRDETNKRFVCLTCHDAITSGKRLPLLPKDRMTRRTETQALALPTFDDEASRTLASTYAQQHAEVEAMIMQCVVDSPEALEKAGLWAEKIKERRELVAKELEFATTLRRFANQFSARWNPAIQPLDRCLDHLRRSSAEYIESSRAALAAALPQATSAAEVAIATQAIAPAPETVIERSSWSAEVLMTPEQTFAALRSLGDPRVDAILAASLPADYLLPDQRRLDSEAREQKQAFAVPGARAKKSVAVAFRGAA